jgi:hypothetical protein
MIRRISVLTALLSCLALGACSGARGNQAQARQAADEVAQGTADGDAADRDVLVDALGGPAKKDARAGLAIVVTWEALAREKYLMENSRYRRKGVQPPQKITLISSSHPDAAAVASGRGNRRDPTASTAILSDKDILAFVKGLTRSGFYRYARPGGYDTVIAGSDNARGRVTVTRGTDSRSILSIRGQGLNEKTKEIPAIYSEAKQAIMVLRNMTPTLNVTRSGASGAVRVR